MRPVKVLHLVEDFKVGGLERVVETIYNGLDRSRYDPHIGCIAAGGDLADRFLQEGKSLQILGLKTYHNPANIVALARYLRRGRFAIVHTHAYFAGTMGRIAASLAGTPVVVHHVHTTYWNFQARHILMERALSAVTARIVCCSDFVRDFVVRREGITSERTVTIHNGVEDRLAEDGDCDRDGIGPVCIAVVASLVENKGHAVLLEAVHRLVQIHPGLELWIVGEGPLRETLEERAGALGMAGRAVFLGQRDDVPRILSRSDIVVLPSLYREGLSVSLIEAMSRARPVVATSVGGARELVTDGVNGFLVAPKDVSALAAKLDLLVRDETLRRAMGSAGRRRYEEKFNAAVMIGRIEALYRDLLAERGMDEPRAR